MRDISRHHHLRHEHYHFHYGLLHRSELAYVEAMMVLLVLLSLITLLSISVLSLTPVQQTRLNTADIIVSVVLLVEFFVRFALSKHKRKYLRHNWWYLLAAVPIATPVATLLRSLRLLGLVKMLRIGIHLREEVETLEDIKQQEAHR